MIRPAQKRSRHALDPMSGVLSVIRPHAGNRGSVRDVAHEMVAARMALAMREDPPHALQLALMQAYQRNRPGMR